MQIEKKEFLPTGGRKLIFKCCYCNLDISSLLRIHCAQCSNVQFCSDCFSAGVEIFNHKNNHPYQVVDCIEYPLFTKDWSIAEELLLLEGIIIILKTDQ
jgi:hypothetical protein